MNQSISAWIPALKEGSEEAVEAIMAQYFEPLMRLVSQRLSSRVRRVVDEEDIALSAMNSFVARARAGRFEQLDCGRDVWRLLVTISLRKAAKHIVRQSAAKRGGGACAGESAFGKAQGLDAVAGDEPGPDAEVERAEMVEQLLAFLVGLDDPVQFDIALWTAQGMTASKLAEYLNCAPRTIERKLKGLREKAQKWATKD